MCEGGVVWCSRTYAQARILTVLYIDIPISAAAAFVRQTEVTCVCVLFMPTLARALGPVGGGCSGGCFHPRFALIPVSVCVLLFGRSAGNGHEGEGGRDSFFSNARMEMGSEE